MNNANVFETAIANERHPSVRRVMGLNAWKITSWREYASWKKFARRWVAIDWRGQISYDDRAPVINFVEI